ncbi:MAG: hypothetical protein IJM59_03855 [Proteobacteria bacterium]|nr:hypothetical protein [Pseudomonadota bacterium]
MKFNTCVRKSIIGLFLTFLMGIPAAAAYAQDSRNDDETKKLEEKVAELKAENEKLKLEMQLAKLEKENQILQNRLTNQKLSEKFRTEVLALREKVSKCGEDMRLDVLFDVDKTGKTQNIQLIPDKQNTAPGKCTLDLFKKHQFPEGRERQGIHLADLLPKKSADYLAIKQESKKCSRDIKVDVSFNVDEVGAPKNIQFIPDKQNTEIEKCILNVIENYQFKRGEPKEFYIYNILSARNAEKGSLPPKGADNKSISPKDLKTGVKAIKEEAKKCGSNGKLSVSFDIDENGKAQNIKSTNGNLQNTDAEKCVIDVMKNYQFPKAEKPVKGINYMFKL